MAEVKVQAHLTRHVEGETYTMYVCLRNADDGCVEQFEVIWQDTVLVGDEPYGEMWR